MAVTKKTKKIVLVFALLVGLPVGIWYYLKKWGRDKFGSKFSYGDGSPWGNKYFTILRDGSSANGGVGRNLSLRNGFATLIATDEKPYYWTGTVWVQGTPPS